MRRREFTSLLGGAMVASPLAARAQQQSAPVIGYLGPGSASAFSYELEGFRRGLAESGYVEGRNVATEYRWAEGQYDRLPALAADLVQHNVAVIAALGSSAPGRAAKAATSTIPIVFQTGGDPVEEGLAVSMSRPGGNITGVSRMTVATDAKRLELLHEVAPKANVIACMVNPTSGRAASQVRQIEDSARSRGLKILVLNVSAASDLESAFTTMIQAGVTALLLANDPSMNLIQNKIVEMTLRSTIATISANRAFVSAGGLFSYDASLPDSYRQAGAYVGRILKGAKPADLPVLKPTKFEFIINLKTAKALGLTIPPTLLALADEVIE